MLLDDPLTGLDRATEQNVLGALFGPRGFVKRAGRSVIMATNSIHHLSYADHVIILDGDGKIDDKGDPTVLCKTNSYLKRLAVDPLPISQAKVPEMQPTEEQLEDMEDSEYADILDQSRRTGDLKVYMYYFQTAGWGVIALYLLTAVVSILPETLIDNLLTNTISVSHSGPTSPRYGSSYGQTRMTQTVRSAWDTGLGSTLFSGPYYSYRPSSQVSYF